MEKIRNLSVRKTIILYMVVSLLGSFLLSAFIIQRASYVQEQIWWKYTDQDQYIKGINGETGNYYTSVRRPDEYVMTERDHILSELCDFLQTYTVLLLSIMASCGAVFMVYRRKLKIPISELAQASKRIEEDDLDFQITYENRDELGQLCRQFERMRVQLVQNNQKLWRSIEEERELRAAIAHDIRSPLSVLKGYQEMLMDYLPDGTIDTEKAVEMLAEAMKQIERMDVFIEAMRRMSSLEQRELKVKPIEAEELRDDIQAELDILAADGGKHVVLYIPRTEAAFAGDKEVILEVTENILSNALRYAREQVEIKVCLREEELRICVRDDGEGFQEDAEAITKAFHQQNAKDSLKHAGLGMYVSRLYCEKHGGKLLLENEEKGGAVVTAVFRRIV